MKTSITNACIIPIDSTEKHWFPGDIGIIDDKIAYIGTIPEDFDPDHIIDADGDLAMPGLVNAHNHLSMTLLRSYADDLDLFTWLNEKIWPVENRMKPEHIYWGSMLGAAEQVLSGITTFADMYFAQEQTIRAVDQAGIRARIGATFMGDGKNAKQRLPVYRELISAFEGSSDGRISIDIAPHAIYTCTTDALQTAADFAAEMSCRLNIHLSESLDEQKNCMKEHGCSPTAYLDRIGFFRAPVYASHCVHMSKEDLDLAGKHHIHIVHNPTSNLKLGNGFAPVPEMLSRGMAPALGTDGASSNNNLNMFEEMHLTSLIHKGISGDPTAVDSYEVLKMATINGARALGMGQSIGSLEVGKDADIILVGTGNPHMKPMHDPVSAIVYSAQASDVHTVFCRGKMIMKDRVLLHMDLEEILQKASEAAEQLIS